MKKINIQDWNSHSLSHTIMSNTSRPYSLAGSRAISKSYPPWLLASPCLWERRSILTGWAHLLTLLVREKNYSSHQTNWSPSWSCRLLYLLRSQSIMDKLELRYRLYCGTNHTDTTLSWNLSYRIRILIYRIMIIDINTQEKEKE